MRTPKPQVAGYLTRHAQKAEMHAHATNRGDCSWTFGRGIVHVSEGREAACWPRPSAPGSSRLGPSLRSR